MVSGKGVLILAIALGLATSLGVYYYVETNTAQARPIRTVSVVVATGAIPPRTLLSRDHVRIAEVPQEARLTDAMVDLNAAVGKVTRIALTPNEQVIGPKLFADRKESGLAFVVPPGKRAVAVAVSEVIGSGGLIVPGDKVDVIGLVELKRTGATDGTTIPIATTLIQNVEVLAVAQMLEGDGPQLTTTSRLGKAVTSAAGADKPAAGLATGALPKTNPNPQPLAKTVTLSVTPEDAQRLALGEEFGHLRLSLRAFGDNTEVKLNTSLLPGMDWLTPTPAPAAPTPAAPKP